MRSFIHLFIHLFIYSFIFEIIIHVFLPQFNTYVMGLSHYNCFISFSVEIDLRRQILTSQILTSKVERRGSMTSAVFSHVARVKNNVCIFSHNQVRHAIYYCRLNMERSCLNQQKFLFKLQRYGLIPVPLSFEPQWDRLSGNVKKIK